MPKGLPSKVLITGGREVGGLEAFARGLAEGFASLGTEAEVITPNEILGMPGALRDPSVLKVLSTTAVFAAPIARRALCVSHCLPRLDAEGWAKCLGIISSLRLASLGRGAAVVAVSDYLACHLEALNLQVGTVIRNPIRSMFFEPFVQSRRRPYLTFMGRLVPLKNLHRLLPAMCDLQEENPELSILIIGDGPQLGMLRASVPKNRCIEFTGSLDTASAREYLRQTKVLVSGCVTEALGVTYLEALSQGCAIAMPASGGGLEIMPDQVGKRIHLLPLSMDRRQVTSVLRRAMCSPECPIRLDDYTGEAIAKKYLAADSQFFGDGRIN